VSATKSSCADDVDGYALPVVSAERGGRGAAWERGGVGEGQRGRGTALERDGV